MIAEPDPALDRLAERVLQAAAEGNGIALADVHALVDAVLASPAIATDDPRMLRALAAREAQGTVYAHRQAIALAVAVSGR